MRSRLLIPVLILGCSLLSGCLISIENRIAADPEVDERLVGVWQIVWRAKDEILDEESPRYIDELGIHSAILIEKVAADAIGILGVDRFRDDGEALTGNFVGKTRSHGEKNFLLLEIIGEDRDDAKDVQIVAEYDFNEEGDLFLWYFDQGLFEDEMLKVRELPHRTEGGGKLFTSTVVTAQPEEILDYLSDPEISRYMAAFGKYRKMVLPEGNSPPVNEEPPE